MNAHSLILMLLVPLSMNIHNIASDQGTHFIKIKKSEAIVSLVLPHTPSTRIT